MRLLLVASLAVNLAVLGIVGGTMFTHHNRGHDGGRDMPRVAERNSSGPDAARMRDVARAERMLTLGPYGSALDVSDRLAIAEAFRARSGGAKQGFREMRESFEATLTLLRAEPFDADALRARIDDQNDFFATRQALSHDLFLARLSEMAPDERAAFADRLEAVLRRGPSGATAGPRKGGDRP
jgi:uncharacterized membrane protein